YRGQIRNTKGIEALELRFPLPVFKHLRKPCQKRVFWNLPTYENTPSLTLRPRLNRRPANLAARNGRNAKYAERRGWSVGDCHGLPLHVRNIDLLAPVDTVSQKPCFLETEVSGASTTRLPHDNVIKEVDIQNSCALRDSFGESEVRWRRARES